MEVTRKGFLGGAAALAAARLDAAGRAVSAASVPKGPLRLSIGLLSDIHVTSAESCSDFEKALRTFDKWGADGVLVCGDLADWGVVPQIERVADTWFRVFPCGKRSDGAKMANLMHYGDHDMGYTTYRRDPRCVKEYPDEDAMRKVKIRNAGRKELWERCFKEEWSPFMHRRVKGYDFILTNFTCGEENNYWGDFAPGLEDYFAKVATTFDANKPFFHSQHRMPRGTVGAPAIYGQDDGRSTRLFSKFPNLFSICGHEHLACVDEQAIWQGAFTCLEVPSLRYCCTQGGRDNGYAVNDEKWAAPDWHMPMIPLGHAKQGMFMRVYDDAIVISRYDFKFDLPLGPDWVVPLPLSAPEKPFAYASRAKTEPAPAFAPGAAVAVRRGKKKERDGKEHDVYEVSFPPAHSASGRPRANDYEVDVAVFRHGIDRVAATKRVYSRHYMLGEKMDDEPVCCDFDAAAFPTDAALRFAARPVNAFARRGEAISLELPVAELKKLRDNYKEVTS